MLLKITVFAYTADSWANFKAIYEKCQELMAKVNDSGFNYESGKPYSTSEAELEQWAQSLTEAVLVDRVEKADTTQLVNLINDFESYDSADFTKTSYDTFAGVVKEIKEAVWGSETNWGDSSFAPNADEAGNKLVADNEARFKEEIRIFVYHLMQRLPQQMAEQHLIKCLNLKLKPAMHQIIPIIHSLVMLLLMQRHILQSLI